MLAPRAPRQLRAEAASATREHSHLSHGAYLDRHAPLAADYQRLKSYLSAARGIQVRRTSADRFTLGIDATVSELEQLFGTTINRYSFHGRQFYANATNPKIPVALAPLVRSISGLDNAQQQRPLFTAKPSSASSPGYPPYAPADIRAGYNISSLISSGLTGSGQTIGVVTLAPFSPYSTANSTTADVSHFESIYGLPAASTQRVQAIGPATNGCLSGAQVGGDIETTLDVEWSSAVAPGATIKTFEGVDTCDAAFYGAISDAVNDSTVTVISLSWGGCEAYTAPAFRDSVDAVLAGALAMGKSFFVASGDSGAFGCDDSPYYADSTVSVDFPASSPYVTAVGGTTLTLTSSTMGWSSETAWSCSDPISCDGNLGGGGSGGGCSSDWTSIGGPAAELQPSWQHTASFCNGRRAVPDVSANANAATPYFIYYSDSSSGPGLYSVGGTSVAAPVWAGIMADINQGRVSHGLGAEGFADGTLSSAGSSSSSPFHDITSGSNGAFTAEPGWDAVTGWGSPDAYKLAVAFGGVTTRAAVIASPSSVVTGGSVTVSWSGVSATPEDWWGIYPVGGPLSSWVAWNRTGGTTSGSADVTIPAGTAAGSYEVRLFTDNTYTVIATASAFTVVRPTPAVSASPSSVVTGGSVTVSWSGVSATPEDWWGIYPVGGPLSSWVAWNRTGGTTSGSADVTIPAGPAAGSYEVRLFTDNTYTVIATSTAFRVS